MAPKESPAMAVSFRNFLRLNREKRPPFPSAFEVRSSMSFFAPISSDNKIKTNSRRPKEDLLLDRAGRCLQPGINKKRKQFISLHKKLVGKHCACAPRTSITVEYLWFFVQSK
jgi:hypothetical protein